MLSTPKAPGGKLDLWNEENYFAKVFLTCFSSF